ncbi:MAG: hypothetical protein ACFCUG_07575 [Thiotrichales bacterium]
MTTQPRDLIPNPVGPFPPLPDPLPISLPEPNVLQPLPHIDPVLFPPIRLRSVRCGCYLINYKPTGSALVSYDGTLRVECHSAGRTASGDLYQRRLILLPILPGFPQRPSAPILFPGPSPAAGIPILARGQYRYYLRVTQILEHFTIGNSFTLGFEMHRFTKNAGSWNTGGTWNNEGSFTALMSWQAAPTGYPSSGDYLEGDLKNSAGAVIGRLTMGWVSRFLRKATVEIDRVAQSEAPLNNGAGVTWQTVGEGVGWDITLDVSDANVPEPSGESWSNAECHAAMLARRAASNLDAEWRYYVLAVRRLDATSRGIMYDHGATDSNNVPREGCALASHWVIPNTTLWGLVKGQRFGVATQPYYRTAVHETGHAMGLYHNTVDNGFMNTTDVIANSASSPGSPAFPNNIQWTFAADDQKRLRHMPDIYVRPGGTPFGTSYATTPISPTDLSLDVEALELRVRPLLESVPIGAPVRIEIELVNITEQPVLAPSTLSLKGGMVRGLVLDPAGARHAFAPLVLCVEEHLETVLEPGASIQHAMTLLRGPDGALFPMPGAHRVIVEVNWDHGGLELTISGEGHVMITAAVDDDHANAALKVLSTPDALLTLVLGGDHLTDGIDAIQGALKNPVLRPHFGYIEAKRVGERFGKRKANLKAAAQLIDDNTVMSPNEIKRAAGLVQSESGDSAAGKSMAKALKSKVNKTSVSDEVKKIVDAL